MSSRNSVDDGELGRQGEVEEALPGEHMTEHHVPESPSRSGFGWASFWIVVNTLATIGIVGSLPPSHSSKRGRA